LQLLSAMHLATLSTGGTSRTAGDAAGLQPGRLTGTVLRGEDLVDAGQVAQQISLDLSREARLVAEGAVDRVRAKFGPDVIGSATVFRRAS
jgi:DNA polymerase-4